MELNRATCQLAVAGNVRLQQELTILASQYHMVKAFRYMRRLPIIRCMLHGLEDYATQHTERSGIYGWLRPNRPLLVKAKDLGAEMVQMIHYSTRRDRCSVSLGSNIAKVLAGQPDNVQVAIPSQRELQLHMDAINAADNDVRPFLLSQGQDVHYDTLWQRAGIARPRVEVKSLPSLHQDEDEL